MMIYLSKQYFAVGTEHTTEGVSNSELTHEMTYKSFRRNQKMHLVL
jgi:hypothetical protein